jgi:glycosidase
MKWCSHLGELLIAAMMLSVSVLCGAQGPSIVKIDPPNWWADMPKPMLLVRGEHLSGAEFTLSDRKLSVSEVKVSTNGHWAEVWLNASPPAAETVTLHVKTGDGETSIQYRFERRRAETDGLAGFSSHDAMYLIMTDRFADGDLTNDGAGAKANKNSPEADAEWKKARGWHGGDLRGISDHLDYIQKTGFTAVWMTPVYANEGEPDSYHGYGATDLYAVDPHYGSVDDLRELAQALHRRHMKLVLDTVPNHVGPRHPWVDDEPDPAWLHGTKTDHHEAVGDFRPLVDPHAPWRDQQFVLQGWFANVLPDLNQENPATKQYLIQNAIWWIEQTGADGLRIDTFPYVGRAFWQEFHAQIHSLYPRLTTVGEIFNCDATITSSFAGGVARNGVDTGLDTPFDFPSYCALRDVFLKGESMSRLADVWRLDALYPHPDRLVPFLGNHDTMRFSSSPGATTEGMKLAFAILFTMRGMPQVYSGDEIAMTGGDDPDNRRDFPGGWPGSAENAFLRSNSQGTSMYDWVRQLLSIRAKYPALQEGAMQVLTAEKDVLAYTRFVSQEGRQDRDAASRVLVIVNRASSPAKVRIKLDGTSLSRMKEAQTLAGDGAAHWTANELSVDMPATAVWIALVSQ